jgi:energy-coupling factor transporter ATP-binding protein EcfA2
MFVERVEVEGGFLSGLNVQFSPGFNVIIGARGSGKTSLIEVIRFCLGASTITASLSERTHQQALSVLGDGRVTVTIVSDGQRQQISRSADDAKSLAPVGFSPPLVMAQNEIEVIGVDAQSRLKLLDGFAPEPPDIAATESLLKSIQSEISALKGDIASLDEQLAALAPVAEELVAARKRQHELSKDVASVAEQQDRLKALNVTLSTLSREHELVRQYAEALKKWLDEGRRLMARVPHPPGSGTGSVKPTFAAIETLLASATADMGRSVAAIDGGLAQIYKALEQLAAQIAANEAEARPIRAKLEELNKGSGEIARRVASLEKRIAQGEALAVLKSQRVDQLQELRKNRAARLEALDRARGHRSRQRGETAAKLSAKLRPNIKVEILESGNLQRYNANITQALRGSGLHAATLAGLISQRIPPRQLIELADEGDHTTLAHLAGISSERGSRLIGVLNKANTAQLIASAVEDDVRLSLLDGADYKETKDLSTGQRCTVILPILLETESGPLIIDQPEDHLDNAFIVQTLIKAVTDRTAGLQLIFSTHNANLPVLGNADTVIQLNSDGRRAFKQVAGPLDAIPVVDAITSVMEGGRAAFERRATFYHEHSSKA